MPIRMPDSMASQRAEDAHGAMQWTRKRLDQKKTEKNERAKRRGAADAWCRSNLQLDEWLVVEVCQLSNCQADDHGGGIAAASAPGGR